MSRTERKRKISWWGLVVAVFFIGISGIELQALNPKDISKLERVFWWICLIFWIFTGIAIIIAKMREKKNGSKNFDE